MGQHPLVSRLLKGIYNTRPPEPRYSTTWDMDVVIRYLQSLGENNTLPLIAVFSHVEREIPVLHLLISLI